MSVDDLFGGRIVTAFVIAAETVNENGERCLDCVHGDANHTPLPWWTVQGLLSAVLETYESVPPIAQDREDDE